MSHSVKIYDTCIGGSGCLISPHGRLCRLQALRNCLPYRFSEHPGLPGSRNNSQYGSSLL